MRILDLDHVQLACPSNSEDEARAFYGALLGLKEVPKPPELAGRCGCWFQVGSRQLHLGVEEPFLPAKKAHPALAVSDVGALSERLTAEGFECVWDEAIPDARRFYSRDPFGNRLEFIERGL